jgi:hypothetical protein
VDVHQQTVMACVRLMADGRVTHELRAFGTSTRELLALADWLAACGCTHVAMSRRGPQKAILAVAASMLTAASHMLLRDVDYHDLGADHFARRDKVTLANRLIRRLRDLGLEVETRPAAA